MTRLHISSLTFVRFERVFAVFKWLIVQGVIFSNLCDTHHLEKTAPCSRYATHHSNSSSKQSTLSRAGGVSGERSRAVLRKVSLRHSQRAGGKHETLCV